MLLACILIFYSPLVIFSQSVTFQNPIPWLTMREGKLVTKVLLDTADLKNTPVVFTLSKIENGKETKLASKEVKSSDYNQEFDFFTLKEAVFGGLNFYSLSWKATALKDKAGKIEPFGIVLISNDSLTDIINAVRMPAVESVVVQAPASSQTSVSLGSLQLDCVWDSVHFGLVIAQPSPSDSIFIMVDGKNGKNSFLAFSDRTILFMPKKDSLSTFGYKRSMEKGRVLYERKPWIQSIRKERNGGTTTFLIPWYDMGIIPVEGRSFGFALFIADGTYQKSFPENSRKEIPGTWGNIILAK